MYMIVLCLQFGVWCIFTDVVCDVDVVALFLSRIDMSRDQEF
jgi:hypothetical protein